MRPHILQLMDSTSFREVPIALSADADGVNIVFPECFWGNGQLSAPERCAIVDFLAARLNQCGPLSFWVKEDGEIVTRELEICVKRDIVAHFPEADLVIGEKLDQIAVDVILNLGKDGVSAEVERDFIRLTEGSRRLDDLISFVSSEVGNPCLGLRATLDEVKAITREPGTSYQERMSNLLDYAGKVRSWRTTSPPLEGVEGALRRKVLLAMESDSEAMNVELREFMDEAKKDFDHKRNLLKRNSQVFRVNEQLTER